MNPKLLVVLLVIQIISYIFCFWKNIKWLWVTQLGFQTLCVAYPIAMHFYLNQDPVTGFEALAGLGEVLRWLVALASLGLTWIVTVITVSIKWKRMLNQAQKKETPPQEGKPW